MASYSNFQSKNQKHTNDRTNIYEAEFNSPVNPNDNSNIIKKHIHKWAELCAYLRWSPDIFYDMIKPETGGINIDLYQRVMMRVLSRFQQNYFCIPRGGSKTLTQIMVAYHTAVCYPNITIAITASTKESAVKIWKEKHDEILRFYPAMADEIKMSNFSKDSGRVEFQNGAIIDNLANAQSSKGLRRRRGSLEVHFASHIYKKYGKSFELLELPKVNQTTT